MGLRIFETDPDAKPRVRQADTVGRFRTGRQVKGQPESLSAFRITTNEPDTAEAIAALYGGIPGEWETSGEDFNEVLTEADKILIVLSGPSALKFDMRSYSRTGHLTHHCDGVESLLDTDKGKPCGCPEKMEDRRAFAKTGAGPDPYTFLHGFHLADDYSLGKFRFQSNSWTVLPFLDFYWADMADIKGEILVEFSLELVEYTTKTGREVSYRRPALRVIKPWDEALADDHGTTY